MGSHFSSLKMLAVLGLFCSVTSLVLGDYAPGYSPYDYSHNYSNYLTATSNTARTRRIFGAFTEDNPFTMEFTFDTTIPMNDLNAPWKYPSHSPSQFQPRPEEDHQLGDHFLGPGPPRSGPRCTEPWRTTWGCSP